VDRFQASETLSERAANKFFTARQQRAVTVLQPKKDDVHVKFVSIVPADGLTLASGNASRAHRQVRTFPLQYRQHGNRFLLLRSMFDLCEEGMSLDIFHRLLVF
jgi:hypothetical protein